jgi:hypothetical protein
MLLAVLCAAAAIAGEPRPEDIQLISSRHSDGPLPTTAELAGRVVVFYQFNLRNPATNQLYPKLNELAREVGRQQIRVIASAAHRGHLNDVWAFSKDTTGSHASCVISLYQNGGINSAQVGDGEGLVWSANGRLLYRGPLADRLDLIRQAVLGGGGVLPIGSSWAGHAEEVRVLTSLKGSIPAALATLRAKGAGADEDATEARRIVAAVGEWADGRWNKAQELLATDATAHQALITETAKLLEGDELGRRFAERRDTVAKDQSFRRILRAEAQVADIVAKAESAGLPKQDSKDPKQAQLNAARQQMRSALQRIAADDAAPSAAAKAKAAMAAWGLDAAK